MKSILLASASVFAFAGAAAADIDLTGAATLGYNDTEVGATQADPGGFYFTTDITFNASQELDNGLTAGFNVTAEYGTYYFDDVTNPTYGNTGLTWTDYEMYIESDTAGLYFGKTDLAADKHWDSVAGSAADNFNEYDDQLEWPGGFEDDEGAAIRGEVTFGGVNTAISYTIPGLGWQEEEDDDNELGSLQLAATGDLGQFNFIAAYQNDENADGEIFGLTVGSAFGGADVRGTYLNQTSGDSSLGVELAYPFGPVTATFFYTANDTADDSYGVSGEYEDGPIAVSAFAESDQGTDDYGLEGSYDVGNGLVIYAGYIDSTEGYVGGEYDLGGGASVLASYADQSEEGAQEYREGTTVEVSFEF